MAIEIRTTTQGTNWERVRRILEEAGLSHDDADIQRQVFERSYAVAMAYDGDVLIGCGRVLSDGLRQAAIYNIALEPAYRGREIGRAIIESLMEQVKGCTVILYTHPQTIGLYETLGFRRQKTGFVRFDLQPERMTFMEREGFLLPEGHRFGDNYFENTPPGVKLKSRE